VFLSLTLNVVFTMVGRSGLNNLSKKLIKKSLAQEAFFVYVLSGYNPCQNVQTFHEKNAEDKSY